MSIQYKIQPGGVISGSVRVPGDKSISHRSVILGALAEGKTEVEGFLNGQDALSTLQAFESMGVKIEHKTENQLSIHGVGLHGLQPPQQDLYLGNAGTAMRLIAGVMSAQRFESVLTGDQSLLKRPMKRIITPLTQMGASIHSQEGLPPLHIIGQPTLKGISYALPVASAQVKSCVLLAGLYAEGVTTIIEKERTRDHTERMLKSFGYPVKMNGLHVSVEGQQDLKATKIKVPADISSAAFFIVAALIAENSSLILESVGVNPTRNGIIHILKKMQADIQIVNERFEGGEAIADIHVKSSSLQGIDIPMSLVPSAIDEFPILFIAAACAKGTTRVLGAEELRVKESDRIDVMATGLRTLGVQLETFPDGIAIQGGKIGGGTIDSCDDHRVAMAFSMAALRASEPVIIEHCENVATSFPGFVTMAKNVGLAIEQTEV